MMHNDGMSQLDLLVKRFSPPLLEVSRDSTEEPNLAPGERVQAHVLANLPNGRFHVLIKDQVLDMNLPSNTQTGDKLDLSVVKTQPRLTFALTEDLRRALPQAAPEVKLSDAVKYLGALLNRATAETPAQAPASLRTEPLLPAQPEQVDTAKLADTLKQTLGESGVFFESHQAEWVTGQRSLQSLMREPQAQLGNNINSPEDKQAASLSANPDQPDEVNRQKSIKAAALNPSNGDVEAKLSVSDGATPNNLAQKPVDSRLSGQAAEHTQLRDLVQQQLNCLDTRQLTWQGVAWPNQQMEWLVQERQEQTVPGEPEQIVWYSRLHLDLPRLGAVTAAISLHNGMVKVHFQSNPATADLVRDNRVRLESQLAAAGMQLLGATVDSGDESR